MITDPAFRQWLNEVCRTVDQTALSQAIQGALWVIPTIQTVHILAIAALMAAALLTNLRMAGWHGKDRAIADVVRPLQPVIWWALPVLLLSGAVLIIGEPARALKNASFQWKLVLITGAIVTV